MSELDQFKDTGQLSLEEFMIDAPDSSGVTEATARQRAGHAAVLSRESSSMKETYGQVYKEMVNLGRSSTAEQVSKQVSQESIVNDQVLLQEIAIDPEVPFEEKKAMLYNLMDKMNEMPNLRNQVSEQALVQDSVNENAEMEFVRVNTGAIIAEVNETKKQQQALINSVVAGSNPDTMDTVIDFAEYLVPFVESKRLQTLLSDYRGEEDLTARAATFAQTVTLLGSEKAALVKALRSMSPAEQLAASQALVSALNSSQELLLPDENDLAKLDFVKTFLEDGYYTTADEWIDNVVSLLDLTILAKPLGSGIRAVRSLAKPTSVAKNLKDTNPGKARALHSATVADDSEEVANAAYGTSRTEAVADDLAFQPDDPDGIENKVGNIGVDFDKAGTPDPEIMDVVNRDGQIYYFEDEKRQARSAVYTDFRNPVGLRLRNEMSSVGVGVGDGAVIRAIYGPTEGGFASAKDAIDTTLLTFRKYGLTEDNVELMMQRGDKYVPVPKEAMKSVMEGRLRPTGGFLTRVNYEYKTNPLDIEAWSKADVKWNIFDRIPGTGLKGQGSLQRHLLDAHSMLHPNITMGAAVAVDKAAGLERNLLDLGKQFTDIYSKLPSDRKTLLDDYIKEANDRGIEFSPTRLYADGYTGQEISALYKWKKYWDTVYHLENKDLGKTLRNLGYKVLEDRANGSRLFAKPIGKRSVPEVYDPQTNTTRSLSNAEIDELYANGGTLAELRDPLHVDDNIVKYVISKEDSGSYLRGIQDGEQVLNYRNGYYSVQYTAPKFIVKRVKDKSGKVQYEKAVAMAGNTKDAELMAKRMATTEGRRFDNLDPEADFYTRDNIKAMRIDSDDYWNLQAVGGRSAQRFRGQRLMDASGPQTAGDQTFVMGPVDSLIHSARNISRRAPMRDYLDATKARFMDQYKDVLPRDEFGNVRFPNNRGEIGMTGRPADKITADARTTFEYINSLEAGYINGIDEAYKATLKLVSNILGRGSVKTKGKGSKALSKAEGGLEALSEMQGPTGFAKNIAFQAYLASAPLRQLAIQAHQSVLLLAVNTKYVGGGGLSKDLMASLMYLTVKDMKSEEAALAVAAKISGRSGKEFKEMWEAWQRSGMGAAVDKQNLIKGSLSEMAEYGKYGMTRNLAQKAVSPITGALTLSRKVGFDAGEYFNSYASWLAYHDKIKQSKKGRMNQGDYDTVTGLARNIALNMNQAGEMPYNQNTLGMFFQFMQVPHKMLTTLSVNRVLSREEKAKLTALNFMMFGVGGTAAYNIFSGIMPEDPKMKDAITNGLEGFMINTLLTEMTGEETRIDFSGLAPTDMYGISDFLTELWTGNAGDILSASPAGQLFFGNNPRITNAFKQAAQYFHLREDYEDPVELSTVLKGFASISSGYSSYGKAKVAWEYGIKRNAYGGIVDENVSSAEAMAQLLGFTTLDERDTYLTGDVLYEDSKAFEDDFKVWYRDIKRNIVASGTNPEDAEFASRVMNAGLFMFKDNKPRFQRLLMQQLKYDVEQNKDYSLFRSVMRASGFMDKEEIRNYLQALPFEDEETKQNILNILDYQKDEGLQ